MHACVISLFSPVRLCVTLCTVAHRAPLSMRFFRQGYWDRLPFSSPRDLPHLGTEPMSPALAGRFSLPLSRWGSPLTVSFDLKIVIKLRVFVFSTYPGLKEPIFQVPDCWKYMLIPGSRGRNYYMKKSQSLEESHNLPDERWLPFT